MNNSKVGFVLVALIMIAVGVFFVFQPSGAVRTVFRIFGIGFLIAGIIGVISYFLNRDINMYFKLIASVLEMIIGLVILIHENVAVTFYAIIAGMTVIIDGVENLLELISMKKAGLADWKAILFLAVIPIIAGLIILFNPFGAAEALIVVTGILLIYMGVINISMALKYN